MGQKLRARAIIRACLPALARNSPGVQHLEKSKWKHLHRHTVFVCLRFYLEGTVPHTPLCPVMSAEMMPSFYHPNPPLPDPPFGSGVATWPKQGQYFPGFLQRLRERSSPFEGHRGLLSLLSMHSNGTGKHTLCVYMFLYPLGFSTMTQNWMIIFTTKTCYSFCIPNL